MPTFRRVVVLLAALAVGMPGVAVSQTTTIPDDGGGVSSEPPVPLDGGDDPQPAPPPPPPAASGEPKRPSAAADLPDTGTDPRLLLLAGATLTLLGVGLRLRTADAELY